MPRINRVIAPSRYRKMLTAEAAKVFMTYEEAVSTRCRKQSRVRFRVFRELYRMGYSLPIIGRVSSRDHTSVLSGLRVIDREEPLDRPTIKPAPRNYNYGRRKPSDESHSSQQAMNIPPSSSQGASTIASVTIIG